MRVVLMILIMTLESMALFESPEELKQNAKELMRAVTFTFRKKALECRKEIFTSNMVLEVFWNFWNRTQPLVTGPLGCMMYCILSKMWLMTKTGHLYYEGIQMFLYNNMADESTVQEIKVIATECEEMVLMSDRRTPDSCLLALEHAKCFRTAIMGKGWTPDLSQMADYMRNTELRQMEHFKKDNSDWF